jgi:ubiquinone/menaquinone biosynthesis C-methylase UbiE
LKQKKSAYALSDFRDPNAEINRLKLQANLFLNMDKIIWGKTDFDFNQQDLRILDLACGLGITTRELARMINTGKVIGVDNNTTLLEYARQYAQDVDNIYFVKKDVYDLIFPEASFDFIFCQFLLLFLTHPDKVVKQVYKMLKPGGTACFVEVDERIAFAYPELPELVSVFEHCMSDLTARGFDLHIGPKLGGYLHHAGFTDINVSIELVTSDQVGLKEFLDSTIKGTLVIQSENGEATIEQIDKIYNYYLKLPYAWLSSTGGFYAVGRKSV